MAQIKKYAQIASWAIAIAVTVAACALVFHYYIRLRLLEHTAVVVVPGKWVWGECRTRLFSATIEEVRMSGIMVTVDRASQLAKLDYLLYQSVAMERSVQEYLI